MVITRSASAAVHASHQHDERNTIEPNLERMDLATPGEHCDLELYGVVEGFYGRPWSWGQRRKLFHMLRDFRLNCYMYAPKDDLKHRAYWKTMYTPEECALLRRMIDDAVSSGIVFVYALSPGVDITYSNNDDIETMKRKLTQIAQLGCEAFALLFDDLDPPQLRDVDAKKFKNFAEAQCTVANIIYNHLGKPQNFLFCPTEYCATRAVPNVRDSEYLRTCGQLLPKNIHILWTGPNVISRFLTAESLMEVENVIERKCTIWDNLHANDYDRQRIYLGPYDRNPQEVVQHVRGILLNPNCEFGANYLPIHSFHTWYHSQDCQQYRRLDASGASQRSSANLTSSAVSSSSHSAQPTFSLGDAVEKAIAWWALEWNIPQDAYGNSLGSYPAAVTETPPSVDLRVDTSSGGGGDDQEMTSVADDKGGQRTSSRNSNSNNNSSTQQFTAGTVVQPDDIRVLTDLFYLPFQYGQIASELIEDFRWLRLNAAMRRRMQLQQENSKPLQLSSSFAPVWSTTAAGAGSSATTGNNTTNSGNSSVQQPSAVPLEWEQRMQRFEGHFIRVKRMCNNLAKCANRALLHELYPYFWDLNHLLSIIRSYLKWLMTATQDGDSDSGGNNINTSNNSSSSSSEWPTPANRNEPWYNRGGLFGEFQRMLPLDVRSSDLFSCAPPDPHTEKVCSIRPYFNSSDRVAVFELTAAQSADAAAQLMPQLDTATKVDSSAALYDNATSANLMLPSTRSGGKFHHHHRRQPLSVGEILVCNSVIGAYLNTIPSRLICFVNCIESTQLLNSTLSPSFADETICGYVMAASEARAFRTNAKPWFQVTANQYIRTLQGVPVDLCAKGVTGGYTFDGSAAPPTTTEPNAMQQQHAAAAADVAVTGDDAVVAQHLAATLEVLCCGPEHGTSHEMYQQYPSIITFNVCEDDLSAANVLKRLLTCALAALKSKGSTGVHAVLNKYNMHLKSMYQRFNFTELERRQVEIRKPSNRYVESFRDRTSSLTLSSSLGEAVTDVETMEIIVLGRSI